MQKLKTNFAFTLVEMIIVITIISILYGLGFINYAYTQNQANLKMNSKDIAQILYSSRNMAINGYESNSGNVSVGVLFDNSEDNKNKITVNAYNYNLDISNSDLLSENNYTKIKDLEFYKHIQLDDVEGHGKFMFFFNAITGTGSYFYWDENSNVKNSFSGDIINIKISYGGSELDSLSKNLKYIVGTNIVDY